SYTRIATVEPTWYMLETRTSYPRPRTKITRMDGHKNQEENRRRNVMATAARPTPATTEAHHTCGEISVERATTGARVASRRRLMSAACRITRSEEHTSELQSRFDLVCRLLLEKKK